MPYKRQQLQKRVIRSLWWSLPLLILGAFVVPDWSLGETRIGATIGIAGALLVGAYSYHIQWRKRLTEAEIAHGVNQQSYFRTFLSVPFIVLGYVIFHFAETTRYKPYYQGGAFAFLIGIMLLAILNIVYHKGLFQQPVSRRKP